MERNDYDDYTANLGETEWMTFKNFSQEDVKKLMFQFDTAINEITFAVLPPREYDSNSFNCLYHKRDKGKMMFILFPDEDEDRKMREEDQKYAEDVAENILEVIRGERRANVDLQYAYAREYPSVKRIPSFDPSKDLSNYKIPFFIEVVVIVDFDKNPAEIIQSSRWHSMTS